MSSWEREGEGRGGEGEAEEKSPKLNDRLRTLVNAKNEWVWLGTVSFIIIIIPSNTDWLVVREG